MDSIWNEHEQSRVINISCDNLFRNRPKINKFKLTFLIQWTVTQLSIIMYVVNNNTIDKVYIVR